jgi:hypothetical protein
LSVIHRYGRQVSDIPYRDRVIWRVGIFGFSSCNFGCFLLLRCRHSPQPPKSGSAPERLASATTRRTSAPAASHPKTSATTRRTSAPAASHPKTSALLAALARRGHRIVATVRFLEAPLQRHHHNYLDRPQPGRVSSHYM